METLGTLCDKLTIVKLKQFHSSDKEQIASLAEQEAQLQAEINDHIGDAVHGLIPLNKLTFRANKVYSKKGNEVADVKGTIGQVFARLADVNCKLWHEQDKVYKFETVPANEKDAVIKQLAVLNLERTRCIDEIDHNFKSAIEKK
jgi:hypothetical protein